MLGNLKTFWSCASIDNRQCTRKRMVNMAQFSPNNHLSLIDQIVYSRLGKVAQTRLAMTTKTKVACLLFADVFGLIRRGRRPFIQYYDQGFFR